MTAIPTFDQVLDAVEQLPEDQKSELIHVMSRRLAERSRERLIATVHQAEAEHAQGLGRVATVEEIMREIRE